MEEQNIELPVEDDASNRTPQRPVEMKFTPPPVVKVRPKSPLRSKYRYRPIRSLRDVIMRLEQENKTRQLRNIDIYGSSYQPSYEYYDLREKIIRASRHISFNFRKRKYPCLRRDWKLPIITEEVEEKSENSFVGDASSLDVSDSIKPSDCYEVEPEKMDGNSIGEPECKKIRLGY